MSAVVYHQIQLQKGLDEVRFTLCGSIMDETWILNFLHQLTNFTEPYIISNWKKSFVTPFGFATNKVFFLLSPNCLHNYQLENDAMSLSRQKNTYLKLQIASTVVPCSYPTLGDVENVSSMNQRKIADIIVSRAGSKSAFNSTLYFHSKQKKKNY